MKSLAGEIVTRSNYLAALFSLPPPAAVVVVRSSDVTVDCSAVLKKLIERFGGKGGGKPDLAQGGGLQGTADDLVDATRQIIDDLA